MPRWRFQQYLGLCQNDNIAEHSGNVECEREESRHRRQQSRKRKQAKKAESSSVGPRRSKMRQCYNNHIPQSAFILPPPTVCDKCHAKNFTDEPQGFCCADGELQQDIWGRSKEEKYLAESIIAIYSKYEKSEMDNTSRSRRIYGFKMYDMHPSVLQLQLIAIDKFANVNHNFHLCQG